LVGYGSIGKRHLENLQRYSKLEIMICTKRKDLKFLAKNVRVFHSLEDALKEKPDIGFITNETSYHVETSIKLAKAGMDLFIEKPLSNSKSGIKTLDKIVKQKKLITLIGNQFRFHPCIKKIHQLVKQKKIGKIISVQVENGSYLPDWHPYEDHAISYASQKKLGGGVVLTQIHDIDYLYWIFGNPKSVFSVTGKFSNLDISVEDYSSSLIQFRNNIIVELHLDFFQGPEYKKCKIKGTNGIIFWDSDKNEIKVYNNKKKKWEIYFKVKKFERNQMYADEMRYFLKCVKNRDKTINNLEDGIKTMNIALGIKKSGEIGRVCKLK
jgi:predicted dehydrogenase|tara:strand:+ start:8888 stop:9859 length:972 start_codon:yes stop_codon:yes gene_type:complete